MNARPGGSPPDFASDANYPAGADPWSSTPTKVNPGSAYIAAGFVPGQGLPAQVMNFVLNAQNPWLSYQDTLEVRSWSVPIAPIYASGHDLAGAVQDNVMAYDADNRKFFAAGQDISNLHTPIVVSSSNGQNWANDSMPVPAGAVNHPNRIVYGPGNGLFAFPNNGTGNFFYRRGKDGAWSTVTITTASLWLAARWFIDRWIFAGVQSGPHPGAASWKPSATTGNTGTGGDLTLPGSSGVTLSAIFAPLMATDGATVLVIAAPTPIVTAPAAQGNLWVTTDGATFTHVSNPFQSEIIALVWNPGDSLFYAMCSESGPSTGVANVYTSPDGLTWTLAATPAITFSRSQSSDTTLAVGCAAAIGGVVVAKAQFTTPDSTIIPGLAIGRNAGTEWDFIPDENQVSTGGPSLVAVQDLGGQIATIRKDDGANSTGAYVSYSLRV
jgi:hypothetical protein